ncbi:MAG: A/G-specific adenine glycosylase [Clostridia bacterium]|nr:A/G-specific adenine glycosylase [Clostridia bacterium]
MKGKMGLLCEALSLAADFYEKEGRALPWRRDADPYHIFLSEIMLQQTRVEAVIPYYERFLARFPTVGALAAADEMEVFKLWEGLGYYSRARNLLRGAKCVVDEHGGAFPDTEEALRTLPGVGEYTAGAIASISFGRPCAAIDGNALRIYARLFGDGRNVLDARVKREVKSLFDAAYPTGARAGATTQGLMEVGQRFCIPNGAPHCDGCPLRALCAVGASGAWTEYPKKEKKKPRRIEARTVLLFVAGDRIFIRRRPDEGLLAGLWEFPNLEGHLTEDGAIAAAREMGLFPEGVMTGPDAKHIFTHIEWHMKGYLISCKDDSVPEGFVAVSLQELKKNYPIASAYRAFLKHLEAL